MIRIVRPVATAALAALLPLAAFGQETPVHTSPQAALEALMSALEADAPENVIAVLGPDAVDLIRDDDAGTRSADWRVILDGYSEGYRFVPNGEDRIGFEIGDDDWPFPIELVREGDGWSFDIDGGREEIVARLIGLNELDTIAVMQAYVELQREFRQIDHDGDGVLEFAAHLISSDGARDGLYWAGDDSPIGDAAARASLDGYAEQGDDSTADPFLGYYYRLLNAQGSSAPGGAMEYIINGNQLAGHALLAVPAVYGETGINSFLVAENGRVLEADLGEATLDKAMGILAYDPDDAWSEVE